MKKLPHDSFIVVFEMTDKLSSSSIIRKTISEPQTGIVPAVF